MIVNKHKLASLKNNPLYYLLSKSLFLICNILVININFFTVYDKNY